jgi:heme/copper-type cytochrome/quinol oxidase subunit 1
MVVIPSTIQVFAWSTSMIAGRPQFKTPLLFIAGFIFMFVVGGLTGIMFLAIPFDQQTTDTYFVIAHFHYVLFGGSIFGIMAGLYHYFPKMFGRLLDERLGSLHFWSYFVGMNLTFFPMHMMGMLGMPRRIYTYNAGQGYDGYNLWSTIGVFFLVFGTLVFVWNFFKSRASGPVAGNNPWDAPTLEWSIPSPPPEYNFARLPYVTSRYPLWDLTHPELTADIPHSKAGDEALKVDAGGKDTGARPHVNPTGGAPKVPSQGAMQVETERYTARELGIPMPADTAKPALAALAMTIMLGGLLFAHREDKTLFFVIVLGGAALLVGSLVAWLTSPLEREEH